MIYYFLDKYQTNCHLYNFDGIEELVGVWYITRNSNFAILFKILHGYKKSNNYAGASIVEYL